MKLENHPFKSLNYYYKGSTFAHVLLFGAFVAMGFFFKNQMDKVRDYNLKLVQSSVKVDVVAMPEMSVQELKSLQGQMGAAQQESSETTRVIEEKKEEITEDSYKVEKKKSSFQDMLKQYSKKVDNKIAKAKKIDESKYKAKDNFNTSKLKNLVLAGNKLSKGESLVGGKSVTETTEFEKYASVLPDLVRENWSIPSYLAEQELQCRIRIFINNSGRLTKASIHESSGNQEYDLRALEAVKKTSFPIPPKKISKAIRDGSILLGFPL
jgi:TonB family protein